LHRKTREDVKLLGSSYIHAKHEYVKNFVKFELTNAFFQIHIKMINTFMTTLFFISTYWNSSTSNLLGIVAFFQIHIKNDKFVYAEKQFFNDLILFVISILLLSFHWVMIPFS